MYDQYVRGDWRAVAKTVRLSEQHGYHYYYQQVRGGIAYMELGHPEQAQPFFREAIALHGGDDFALQYLYSSYTEAQQWDRAWRLRKRYPELWAIDTIPAPKVLASFAEGGVKVIPGGHPLFATNEFVAASVTHRLGLRSRWQWYYQYLGIRWAVVSDNNGSGPGSNASITERWWFPEHQIGLLPTIDLSDRWRLSGAFHALWVTIDSVAYRDLTGSLQLTRRLTGVDFFVAFAAGRLLNTTVVQGRAGMVWRPLGQPTPSLTVAYVPHYTTTWQHTWYAMAMHTIAGKHTLSLMANGGNRNYYIDPENYQLFNFPFTQQLSARAMYTRQVKGGTGWHAGLLYEQKSDEAGIFLQYTPYIGITINP